MKMKKTGNYFKMKKTKARSSRRKRTGDYRP